MESLCANFVSLCISGKSDRHDLTMRFQRTVTYEICGSLFIHDCNRERTDANFMLLNVILFLHIKFENITLNDIKLSNRASLRGTQEAGPI
jgi:hypothetical protein